MCLRVLAHLSSRLSVNSSKPLWEISPSTARCLIVVLFLFFNFWRIASVFRVRGRVFTADELDYHCVFLPQFRSFGKWSKNAVLARYHFHRRFLTKRFTREVHQPFWQTQRCSPCFIDVLILIFCFGFLWHLALTAISMLRMYL